MGKAGIRAALYWPAISAMTHCPGDQGFCRAAGGSAASRNKVIIGAVMRKLVHIAYGVLKHQTPYDPSKVCGRLASAT